MELERKDFTQILRTYGVWAPLTNVQKLQSGPDDSKQLRQIFRLDTTDRRQWVCRLSHETNYPIALVERQSAFAMFLRANGVPTPKKLRYRGRYCLRWPQSGLELCVTLESYMGSDVEYADLTTFRTLGSLLGQMHVVSQEHPIHLGFSTIAHEISTGRARYVNILRQAQTAIPQISAIRDAAHLHDALVSILRPMWQSLPRGAVHGDLGLYNNLVISQGELAVIDFNLAGDEVFLGDLLAAYYSSVHKYDWQTRLANIDSTATKQMFLAGYTAHRNLTMLEQQYFPTVAALFDGLFYSKEAIERWNELQTPAALAYFEKVPVLFAAGLINTVV